MKKRIYTDNEIKKLKACLFVREIKRKCEIDYDPVFKLWTIMMRYEFPELTAREIFARAGFDIDILNNKLPQRRIKEWKDNYIKFGVSYFLPEDEVYKSKNKISMNNHHHVNHNIKYRFYISNFIILKKCMIYRKIILKK